MGHVQEYTTAYQDVLPAGIDYQSRHARHSVPKRPPYKPAASFRG
jgi:hypothetical protein